MNKLTGTSLATAAALIVTSGLPVAVFAADSAKVHCAGVNSCKGTSECSTAKNACAGQNTCKGQGWVSLTKEQCVEAQAKVKAQDKGEHKPEASK